MNNRGSLQDIFKYHPNSLVHIRQRLAREGNKSAFAPELDIADDGIGWDTDQNHICGAAAVFDLANLIELRPDDFVLDVGCGLGGSLRLLADRYHCRGVGIDISSRRLEDARAITAMTRLDTKVSFAIGDATSMCLGAETFSVVWGRNSWAHMFSTELFAEVRRVALKGARLALEEVCLESLPASALQKSMLLELEDVWCLKLRPIEEWQAMAEGMSWDISRSQSLSSEALAYLETFAAKERVRRDLFPSEYRGISLALDLFRDGIAGYFRMTGTAT